MEPLSHIEHALVIEDEYLLAIDIKENLEMLGCRGVQLAADAAEAERCLAQQRTNLVTLDIRLGEVDCESLAELLVSMRVAFLYVTGFARHEKPHFPSAPWVVKPLAEADLVSAVQALGLWRPAGMKGYGNILRGA